MQGRFHRGIGSQALIRLAFVRFHGDLHGRTARQKGQ